MMDNHSNAQIRTISTAEGIELQEQEGFSLLHVMTRGDRRLVAEALAARLDTKVCLDPNTAATNTEGIRVLWFGPNSWLLHAPVRGWEFASIRGCAVTELSDSRRIFTLCGDAASESLIRYCPLDFQSQNLGPGHCALTQFEQFPLLLHVTANNVYDLYIERSYSEDLFNLLHDQGCRP